MQHAQILANEHEVANALARYKVFYDSAPIGYFIVGLDGLVIECNRAGARLLGIEGEEIGGRPLVGFLADQSRSEFRGLLKALRDSGADASCEVHSRAGGGALRIAANLAPGGATVLLVICELERSQAG